MSEEKDFNTENGEKKENEKSIDEILKEFQSSREAEPIDDESGKIAPPVHYRDGDFTQKSQPDNLSDKDKKEKRKIKMPNINVKRLLIIVASFVVAAAVVVSAVFGAKYAVKQSQSAYLKPYEEKYPGVNFPVGIMEKYCDIYGENPTAFGYIDISETSLTAPVLSEDNGNLPYAQKNLDGCEQFNYVVYLSDNSLEKYYSTADAYNKKTSGYISYSDLFNDYRFKVVGAFYTNTQAIDDNGYIFPYNVTEKMTTKSYNDFFDRLDSRFIYDTGVTLTRQDKLLTISCPTDFRENFRFVVVGVLRNDSTDKPTAVDKEKVHYPQVVYNDRNQKNTFALAFQWYPEIILSETDEKQITRKQSIDDYK